MKKTAQFGLNQREQTDRIMMEDFNRDNAKVEAALADQAASITGLTAQLAAKGNCQIYTTTYVGTGTYGAGSPTQLTFPKPPLAIFVTSPYGVVVFIRGDWGYSVLSVNDVARMPTTWSGNTVSWYHSDGSNQQQNNKDATYHVVALMEV